MISSHFFNHKKNCQGLKFLLYLKTQRGSCLHMFRCYTFGSPCEANRVRKRSNGYDPTVAAHPANAPLTKDR